MIRIFDAFDWNWFDFGWVCVMRFAVMDSVTDFPSHSASIIRCVVKSAIWYPSDDATIYDDNLKRFDSVTWNDSYDAMRSNTYAITAYNVYIR